MGGEGLYHPDGRHGQAQGNFCAVGRVVEQFHALEGRKTFHGVAGEGHIMFGQAGKPFRAQQTHVDERAQGAEGLVGADVGRGLGRRVMLFPRLGG